MSEVSINGLDLAKNVFQANVAARDDRVLARERLPRSRMVSFFSDQPKCLVAMEACASAHHSAREIQAPGHDVRLIPPIYVKPFVKRQKNDSSDAEAARWRRRDRQCDLLR